MSFAVDKLQTIQEKNKSMICLGLDLDPKRMPADSAKSIKTMYEFAMRMVEATKDVVCAYKPNMAFYETLGHDGLSLLESICKRIPEDIPIILDGKRGDIGNTASFYAEAMFDRMNADWVTLNPYMGYDALRPFLEHKDKGIFVLCLTSNTGSKDFQLLEVDGKALYKVVAEKVDYWNKDDNCGLVVGATQPEQLKELRSITGGMPLLIPGVGAQGGSLEKAVLYGTDEFKKIAVINVSRSVLYASNGADFDEKAREELVKLNSQVEAIRKGERTADEVPQPETKQEPQPEQNQQSPEQQQSSGDSQDSGSSHLSASAVSVPSAGVPSEPQEQPQQDEQPVSKDEISSADETEPVAIKPQETEAKTEPVTPVPAEPETTGEPKPSEQPQQSEPEKKPEQPPQQTQPEPRKEPPPMPKPPPPLPPVPEIPRFDKPKDQTDNRENANRQENRHQNNDRNRQFGNNNRFKKRHDRRNHNRRNDSNFRRRQDDNRNDHRDNNPNREQDNRPGYDNNN